MSRHNYTQYANNKKNDTVEVVDVVSFDNTCVVEEETHVIEPTVETVSQPETINGVVANCAKLNVRVAPNSAADVACVIDAKSTVVIDVAKSTEDWYNVFTVSGVEGYCMKQYIDVEV